MTPQLDLVLVNPGSRTKIYQGLSTTLAAVENPVWAGLIATFARTKGYSVAIVDAGADDLTPEQAGTLCRGLVGGMSFLLRVRTCMEKALFAPGDPVYQMPSNGQGVLVTDAGVTLDHLEITGAAVPDGE